MISARRSALGPRAIRYAWNVKIERRREQEGGEGGGRGEARRKGGMETDGEEAILADGITPVIPARQIKSNLIIPNDEVT